jgi:oxepin-CoA hydrolase/3-oxo-5,6-dehydrosuberyl-CoA semialdehyde dehydrogenase
MDNLASYVQGRWHVAPNEGTVVADAATGAPIAAVSSTGVDFAAAIAHARATGGPALRELTFHQRGALLKNLALYLEARKDAYFELSYATGATRRDSAVDIDGGIGTLFAYASRARRELPDDTVLLDGAREPIGKGGTFAGQHLYTSPEGVAVHVNAFNFPVWGMLEKLAPTLLAGVPAIVKPATQTAYLAARVFRDVIDSGLLPPGSVQLICGGVGDLLDHLGGQDAIAFTGSAATAAALRGHLAVTLRGARFNAEADSLNCSILGPDAGPGTAEFDLYVREVFREMTVKAGQKCTAIRRALVPGPLLDPFVEALRAKLEGVVVGDPRQDGVTMGALAGVRQREEVLEAAAILAENASVVAGALAASDGPGAFVSPVLLVAEDAAGSPAHDVEAFGPVCTVLPYTAAEDAIALAARGRGSLVGSVVSHDPGFVRPVALGLAAHHGRVLVLDRDSAGESTGHGIPMPQLVHGGPGRAGGGEELGGIRAVLHYMRRTAFQGSPAILDSLGG